MTDPAPPPRKRRHRTPYYVAAAAALVAVQAAAWFHFRKRQPDTDEQTRDRLRPKGRGRP